VLHAVNSKKARLDAFRGPGHRLPLEDIITSTIFGPLLFMDPIEAATALSLVLSGVGYSRPEWQGPTHLTLWPKHKTVYELRSRHVEPDAEIVDASGSTLVIEIKWGAPLSPHELASQWLALKQSDRKTSRHLLIVLEPQLHYHEAIARDRATIARHCDLPWTIKMVTWRRMSDAFRVLGADMRLDSGTRRWALGVHGLLRREDRLALSGWQGLDITSVPENPWRYQRRLINFHDALPEPTWRYLDD